MFSAVFIDAKLHTASLVSITPVALAVTDDPKPNHLLRRRNVLYLTGEITSNRKLTGAKL